MADAISNAADAPSLMRQQHFLLRRLHSLSGILPVGVFVCFHLFTNMQMAFGTFQHEVQWIHSLPALWFAEVFGIWLPIAFHAGLGVAYTAGWVPNNLKYTYADNWRYTLQRVTGIIALFFIFFHIATLRWRWDLGILNTPFFVQGVTPDGEMVPLATASTALAIQSSALVILAYIVGAYSVVFHFANGLWTAAIAWGLTISVKAQKRWGFVCIGVFLALASFTTLALYASLTYEPSERELAAYNHTVELYNETGHLPGHGDAPATHGQPSTTSPADH